MPRGGNDYWSQISATGRRTTLQYQPDFGPVQDKYPAYNGFPWAKIQEVLKKRWPNWTAFKELRVGDSWQFEVPAPLTEADREALRTERDRLARQRPKSESPEPEDEEEEEGQRSGSSS